MIRLWKERNGIYFFVDISLQIIKKNLFSIVTVYVNNRDEAECLEDFAARAVGSATSHDKTPQWQKTIPLVFSATLLPYPKRLVGPEFESTLPIANGDR